MTITIDKAFVNQYRDLVIFLAQQKDNRLRKFVTEVSLRGEAYNFDRLDKVDAVEKVGRRVATAYVDDTWDRRVATPKTFNITMSVEHEDKVQMLINPDSAYAEAQAMAMRRAYDDQIITAATGTALDGDGTAVAFPATQKIGDGTAALDFDVVTQVQEKFLSHDIDMDVPKIMVVGPAQIRALLKLTQQTSSDYVKVKALQTLSSWGIVPNWMGFTWILSNRLTHSAAGKTSCLSFTKRGLGLAVNKDVFVRIGENPSMSYMIQVFCQYTAGAIRIEDEHVVHVEVAD